MPNIMLHDDEARQALGRGVAKLARAVRGTLGPRGMNAIIDRPIGTPIISRDGVSIASEIELEDPFENMGAQVLREVSKQTNEVAGDGTTTATVLADALVQDGLACLAKGANPVELVEGLELAVAEVVAALKRVATPLRGGDELRAVAVVAANDDATGHLVAEALERVGADGIVDVAYGSTVETSLEVVDGMAFDRGYLSHHMITDVEKMQVVLDDPYILMTDQRLQTPDEVAVLVALVAESKRPLLVIAEEVAPACVVSLLAWRQGGPPVAAIHPPEYGHWRKAALEDLAILTGGRVIARDLGGSIASVQLRDLGSARHVRISSNQTIVTAGGGDPAMVAARRQQVARQYELAPENIERDKIRERLSKLSGGTAILLAGGATPVEQKRRLHLIEDAINAARAAIAEGVVPGGGLALLHVANELDELASSRTEGHVRQGVRLLQRALQQPLHHIAANCGLDPEAVKRKTLDAKPGVGLDARRGRFVDLVAAGIIDPVKVSYSAVRNAASVAGLILTTQTLIAKKPDCVDPTAGPALGGGAELLGRK